MPDTTHYCSNRAGFARPGGSSGTAYPSDSCAVVLIEIAADLESQLEIVSKVPRDLQTDDYCTFRRSTGLLQRARDATKSRKDVQLSHPRSAEEEQALAMMGSPAASRKSSSSAPQEGRTPLGASAGISRTHPPVTPTRAVTSKSDVLLRQPPDLAEALANLAAVLDEPRSSQSLEREFGVNPGRVTTETEYTEVLNGGGSGEEGLQRLGVQAPLQRMLHGPHEYPGVIIATHAAWVREGLATPPGASWSWRHAREHSLSSLWSSPDLAMGHRESHRRLRCGQNRRVRTPACQIYGMLESAAKDSCPGCPTPTPVQTSIGRPPKLQQSSQGTRKRLRSRQQRNNI